MITFSGLDLNRDGNFCHAAENMRMGTYDAPGQVGLFKDPQTQKTLIFLTNDFALPALTITELYRCRRLRPGRHQMGYFTFLHHLEESI